MAKVQMTLNDVFNDYIKVRKSLKHNTLYSYQKILNAGFADWRDKAFLAITKHPWPASRPPSRMKILAKTFMINK